jgi:hypothetical protein
MKIPPNPLSKQKRILLPIILLAIFITVVLIIRLPIKQTFEYNPDEGVNLMKSLLFLNGFSLYKEISNDQPPLFTAILSYWFKLLGPSVYYGRILILIFSCLLLWAFYQTIKNLWGDFCALTAVIFLLLSVVYLNLSISIMIGTPALSLAMLSIYFMTLYRKRQFRHLLVLSGISLALSLQIKLFTMFLLPLMVLEIIQARKQSHPIWAVCLWLGSFGAMFLGIAIAFFGLDLSMFIQQLFQPHLRQIEVPESNFVVIWRMLLRDFDIALLALIGIILLVRQKKWQFFFPFWCLALTLAILLVHRPVWHHYYLPASIFLSWLAAISFSEFFRVNMKKGAFLKMGVKKNFDIFLRWITAAMIILTILRLPIKCTMVYRSIWGETAAEERRVVELLLKYRESTRWIITDRPIFAFYANILVPPELALVTHKRQFTEDPEQDYLINKIKKYEPELILLNRLQYYGPEVISYIEENYRQIYQGMINKLARGRVWVPKRIYWIPKFIRFLNREWCYSFPILRGGYFREIKFEKEKEIWATQEMRLILYQKRIF